MCFNTDILVFYQFIACILETVIKDILLVGFIYINDILENTFMKKQQHVTKTNVAMATNISHCPINSHTINIFFKAMKSILLVIG